MRSAKRLSIALAAVILLVLSACGTTELPTAVPKILKAPTAVTAEATGDGEVTVSWTAPGLDYLESVDEYTVISSPGGVTVTSRTISAVVTGLENGTAYTFTVTATNENGTSVPSEPSNEVTPTAQ